MGFSVAAARVDAIEYVLDFIELGRIMKADVPYLSSAVARLAAARPDSPQYFEEVFDAISSDPGLSGEAFRLANSAALRGSERCESLIEAMMRVGAARYVALVLGSYLVKVLAPTTDELRELWRRNVFVAVAASELCRRFPQTGVLPDVGFVAGMLHNVGLLALAVSEPGSYKRLTKRIVPSRSNRCELERELFGLDHTQAGELVADAGCFPQDLREVILHHDAEDLPETLSAPRLVRTMRLCTLLANTCHEDRPSDRHATMDELPELIEDELLGVSLEKTTIAELQTAISDEADRQCEHLGLFASGSAA